MERKTGPKPKTGFERHEYETKPVKIDPLAETGKYATLTAAEIARRTQEPKSAEKTLILQQAEEQRRQEEEARRMAEVERMKAELRKEAASEAAPKAKVLKRRNHEEPKKPEPPKTAVESEPEVEPITPEEPKRTGLWGLFRKRKKRGE